MQNMMGKMFEDVKGYMTPRESRRKMLSMSSIAHGRGKMGQLLSEVSGL